MGLQYAQLCLTGNEDKSLENKHKKSRDPPEGSSLLFLGFLELFCFAAA